MILPVLCPRAWSAPEVTGNFCVRHIRSQGDSLGTLMSVRSQKIKKLFLGGMIYDLFTLFSSFVHCSMHSPPKQNNPVAVCRGRRIEEWEIHISPGLQSSEICKCKTFNAV